MQEFITNVEVRWADLDPNFHLRHSVYYDWGALSRINFFTQHGLSIQTLQRLNLGPILFREECVFKKEIRFGDKVTVDLKLVKTKKNFSRWTLIHTVKKSADIVSAIITIDAAWLNTMERKLIIPPEEVFNVFNEMPTDEDFQWQE